MLWKGWDHVRGCGTRENAIRCMESVTVQAARAAPSLVRPTVYRVVRSVSGAEGWDLGRVRVYSTVGNYFELILRGGRERGSRDTRAADTENISRALAILSLGDGPHECGTG